MRYTQCVQWQFCPPAWYSRLVIRSSPSPTHSTLLVQRVRKESLFPIAGTTHLYNNLINTTSIQGVVNLLLLDIPETGIYHRGI
jgi:hypothetical protein